MQKDKAILITGATGFVGSHLCKELIAAGYTNLYAIKRSSSQLDLLGEAADALQWRTAELTDYFSLEEALVGVEVVIHCAALVSFQPRDKDRLLQINRVGTRYLINAALKQGVERLIYLSSVAALGRKTSAILINEQSKWEDGPTITNYARSKFLAELEVWRGQAEGLSVGVLYPSIILGPGNWASGSAKLFSYAFDGPTYYPSGETGVVDVADVAKATRLCLEQEQDGARFLLNGTNISYQELLCNMCMALGKPAPEKAMPARFALVLSWLDSWRALLSGGQPLLTRETVRNAYHHFRYDNMHSVNKLGMKYRSIVDTIRQTAVQFLSERT